MRLAPYAVTMFNAPTISIEQIIPLSNVITILIANHSAQKFHLNPSISSNSFHV